MSATVADYRDMAARAVALETMLGDIAALLEAVDICDMPPLATDDRRVNAGLALLDIARRRALEFEALPGLELSARLSRLADGNA